ncbi:phosphonate ABC transporter, permease protein PhnE [Fructilactobacillus sanfranciscensis]|uniref:phosphonate ABC transporter, permease protein PhnE n=1 Tax=Fructilactobacillus sanfranciscensis TaxID=1625 RepID=UPI000CD3B55B|nr:phosphonate ABC transporter, permease protein PhnE [Fructilactobacillus sanfranciscensis]NDR70094.1 phosphonate ABC transporter, permease protein PhnE [Fructilactobacillus sanfranciscensis]NDS16181.1 phosphonate ABC transporter, permease protein PhnE [Fructilactobacillus sanfranciscensis]POH20125.1 phosphonate ABC transporter, permease protein PhnE [Fructilactobacillus sanfranciscensis]WED57231.1 phosphonate ABC transporter, permease protein PhnE [Fructilactobacillus sanfranciscensis]
MNVPKQDFVQRFHIIGISIAVIMLVLIYFSSLVTGVDFDTFMTNIDQFGVILGQMKDPDWSYLAKMKDPLLQTVQMAILGTTFGTALAIPFSILAARNIVKNRIGRGIIRIILSLIRTLPNLLLAALFVAIFGIGPMTGVITLALFSFGMVSKLFYEVIETIDMGPVRAIRATGASMAQTVRIAVMPQVAGQFMSDFLYTLEINVRSSTVLGYLGAGGIGLYLQQTLDQYDYPRTAVIIISIFVVVLVIDTISNYLRKRLQ